MLSLKGILGAIGCQLMAGSLYPLTQIYQLDKDKKNGDQTIAITLGINLSFTFSIVMELAATFCFCLLIGLFYSIFQAILFGLYMVGFAVILTYWKKNFQHANVKKNFKILHKILYTNSTLFFGFFVSELLE